LLGTEQRSWAERLDRELPNVRAALSWLLARGEGDASLRLAGSLLVFWFLRGHLREGCTWLNRALEHDEATSPADRAWALFALGLLTWAQGDFSRANAVGDEARAFAREHELPLAEGFALYLLFLASSEQLQRLEAIALGEEAIWRMREAGDRGWLAYMLCDVGDQLVLSGDVKRGRAMLEEGLSLHRDRGNKQGLGNKLTDLGIAEHDAGNELAAARYYREGLRLLWEGGDTWYLAGPLSGLATIVAGVGNARRVANLIGAASALREKSGSAPWPKERARFEQTVAMVRAALGDDAYAREEAIGRAMPLADVLAEVAAMGDGQLSDEETADPGRLSPRELEVLRLLATGRSNSEIAVALFIGRGTVRTHVSNILGKLGARTRTEASALARERGLI
jgi:DNA-binding CsgD family transcriptional regulator